MNWKQNKTKKTTTQLMQKLSASPKSQYSPWCCTVQMAGVSAYQSECCHGAESESGENLHAICSTLSNCFCCLSIETHFRAKRSMERAKTCWHWVNCNESIWIGLGLPLCKSWFTDMVGLLCKNLVYWHPFTRPYAAQLSLLSVMNETPD